MAITELSATRYENTLLKLQACQTQCSLLQSQYYKLLEEQTRLLDLLRSEAGVDPEAVYNPITRSF